MTEPKICPVCSGTGIYKNAQPTHISGISSGRICHGCNGKGWVTPEYQPESENKNTEKPRRKFPIF